MSAGNSRGGWISLELARLGRVRSATGLSPAGFHNLLEGFFQRASLACSRFATAATCPSMTDPHQVAQVLLQGSGR